jgi:hypothetical protein
MRFQTFAITAIFATNLASAAFAVIPLTPARYIAGVRHGAQVATYNNLSPIHLGYTDSAGMVSADGFASPTPTVKIQGGSGPDPLGVGIIANSSLSYQFAILSPVPGTIHLLITAVANASGYGNFNADSVVSFNAKDGSLNLTLAHAHASSASFNNVYLDGGTNSYAVLANKIYTFRLSADGNTKNFGSGFSALADPLVRFDPAFSRPAGSSLSFSPNIPTSVPEPASWALLLIGFGLVGAVSRRRQTAVPA